MSRPLLVTDCDEVLLHMVAHFADWLDEEHDVRFDLESGDFAGAMTDRRTGEVISPDVVWPLLDGFFRGQMHRQTLVPGALEALQAEGIDPQRRAETLSVTQFIAVARRLDAID